MTPDKDLSQLSAEELVSLPVFDYDDSAGMEAAWFEEKNRRVRRLERIERELKEMLLDWRYEKSCQTTTDRERGYDQAIQDHMDELQAILNDADRKGEG